MSSFFFLLAFGLHQIQPFQVQGPIDRSGGLTKMLIFENPPVEGRMDKEKHKKGLAQAIIGWGTAFLGCHMKE